MVDSWESKNNKDRVSTRRRSKITDKNCSLFLPKTVHRLGFWYFLRVETLNIDQKCFTSISLFDTDNAFRYFSFVANVSDALIFLDVAMQIQIGGQLYRMGIHERILSYPMGLFYWSVWRHHFSFHYYVSKFVVLDQLFSFQF